MDTILRDHLVRLGYKFTVEVTTQPVYWSVMYRHHLVTAGGHNSDRKVTVDWCWNSLFKAALEHAAANGVRL